MSDIVNTTFIFSRIAVKCLLLLRFVFVFVSILLWLMIVVLLLLKLKLRGRWYGDFSSRDEIFYIIRPLESVYMWSFIPGWDLSRDETIPVYGEIPLPTDMFAEMKFHPRMKKNKTCKHFIPWDGSEESRFPLILFYFYNRYFLLLQVFLYFQLLFFTSNSFIYFQPSFFTSNFVFYF